MGTFCLNRFKINMIAYQLMASMFLKRRRISCSKGQHIQIAYVLHAQTASISKMHVLLENAAL